MTRNSRSIARSFNAAMEEIGRAHDLNLNRYRVYNSQIKIFLLVFLSLTKIRCKSL